MSPCRIDDVLAPFLQNITLVKCKIQNENSLEFCLTLLHMWCTICNFIPIIQWLCFVLSNVIRDISLALSIQTQTIQFGWRCWDMVISSLRRLRRQRLTIKQNLWIADMVQWGRFGGGINFPLPAEKNVFIIHWKTQLWTWI